MPFPAHEGFAAFQGHQFWYRVVGDGKSAGKLPLLCLHGGPGAPHDYLEPLEALAATGRRVIFYDQLGCGHSDHPDQPDLWTVPLFLEELGVIRRTLRLDRLHILGQSWGGMLALEYALTGPTGVASLILADSLASVPLWVREADRLRCLLPPAVQETLQKHEQAGTTDDPAYQEAMLEFYRRHVCRLDPWPDCLKRTFAKLTANPQVYATLWGPSEFHPTGRLHDWDLTRRLGEIRRPTLVLSGEFDESTPAVSGALHRGITGAEWVVFKNCSHTPHLENPAEYLQTVESFMDRAEKTAEP